MEDKKEKAKTNNKKKAAIIGGVIASALTVIGIGTILKKKKNKVK